MFIHRGSPYCVTHHTLFPIPILYLLPAPSLIPHSPLSDAHSHTLFSHPLLPTHIPSFTLPQTHPPTLSFTLPQLSSTPSLTLPFLPTRTYHSLIRLSYPQPLSLTFPHFSLTFHLPPLSPKGVNGSAYWSTISVLNRGNDIHSASH